MTTITCTNIIKHLVEDVNYANHILIYNMFVEGTDPRLLCSKSTTGDKFYSSCLRELWTETLENFKETNHTCGTKIKDNFIVQSTIGNVYPNITDNGFDSLFNVFKIFVLNCRCRFHDIFSIIIDSYKPKINKMWAQYDTAQKQKFIQDFYEYITNLFSDKNVESNEKKKIMDSLVNRMVHIYNFSIDNELDILLPDKMGSIKDFFKKLLSTYFNNLPPIIWAQIFKALVTNLFIELPLSPSEIYGFFAKHLLLNSGPFILKTLQLVRPLLSAETAAKYNINKLSYPLMSKDEIEMILSNSVPGWENYQILANFSASVGHVVKVKNNANLSAEPFMIKIIKPLSISQSCWEYRILQNVFPGESCEAKFIKTNLENVGDEFDVRSEMQNILQGRKLYYATYKEEFKLDVDATLSTIDVVRFLPQDSWYMVGMTVAPGLPLNNIIDNNDLTKDTKFRANLHRCLDLLVYKFFNNIVRNGFYHGDLHSGNIFYSFLKNQMTLIDFGAVGKLDIYDTENKIVNEIIDINIMSIFYNYVGILKSLTKYVNSVCTETKIDTNDPGYHELKNKLNEYRKENIKLMHEERGLNDKFAKEIFGETRLQNEHYAPVHDKPATKIWKNIYTVLQTIPEKPDVVEQNKESLPELDNIRKDTNKKSLNSVLLAIFDYFANSGVNIAVKMSEFYRFNKAYSLLLGVLHATGYKTTRLNIVMKRAILNLANLNQIYHVGFVARTLTKYYHEYKLFNENK